MENKKAFYPLRFIPIPSKRPWGGDSLIKILGKSLVETDEDGNETALTVQDRIGESWEVADMGFQESVVQDGWLAGNTIEDLMDTYFDRIVGEDCYNWFGRQFPLLVKFLDIREKLSVQVHPDDETAAQRYDSLGKAEIWYVMDAQPGAKVYMGFKRQVSAQELYDRCHNGTVEEILNVIYPKKGDSIFITPGTVHAADGGLLIAEIQESSDVTFRLYDWGREFNPATARKMHLDEAMDIINYGPFDASLFRKGPLWAEQECGHDHHDGHCGCEGHHHEGDRVSEKLVSCPQFTVTKLNVTDPLHIYTEKFGAFLIYICPEGEVSIQVPAVNEKGEKCMDNYILRKGETILIPADMSDFYIVPREKDSILLEATVEKHEQEDEYIDPNTEPFLEGEDYEGAEDEECDDDDCDDDCCHGDCHHHLS